MDDSKELSGGLEVEKVTLQEVDERMFETCFNREAVVGTMLTKLRSIKYVKTCRNIYGVSIVLL